MYCPSCGFDSPEGMNYCGECGIKLIGLCPECGFENIIGSQFCSECGRTLIDLALLYKANLTHHQSDK